MRSSAVLILAALAAEATAYYNYTFPTGFNLGLVPSTTLSAWCQGERNTCPLVCGGAASANDCDANTLNFDCTCSNGTTPDLTPYKNTIPFYVCLENFNQCIANHPNDLDAQTACKANATCGTIDLSAVSTTSASSSSTTAASTTAATAATSTTGTAASATASHGAAALQVSTDRSTGLGAAAMLAVFGMML
ncbi:hypothetical protein TMatcc_005920 [Talaromyces marneffei ATCC 18224]|uniref:DUF7707 domain-containing protein n=2 Tax=Talaromyces marneffei TaxID=37727 RepID=B6Q8N7_TALMQ|nr:uncharacterized protein EYB26_005584 [Talaromyces marneffei]EEA25841.1 conserved hypothetical protein [Talaromyces marneffei ATCC 18224]KAE8554538.1 hypothetical protein EYB25_003077 [Talaromyces marneffei]QGA17908.1 hypothetical protein EYB26_005584 [Talaromyces marneffei]